MKSKVNFKLVDGGFERAAACLIPAAALAACIGCGQSDGRSDPGTTGTGPVYAAVSLVWSDDRPTGYVALSDKLELDGSLRSAREFPGYTSIGVHDGQLLVSPSAEDLTIERFEITDRLEWVETGRLSFANEGVESVGFFRQYMRRQGGAYVDVDGNGRALWDSRELAIQGRRVDEELALKRDGLDLFANFNRTYFEFGDDVLRPFSYTTRIGSAEPRLADCRLRGGDARGEEGDRCPLPRPRHNHPRRAGQHLLRHLGVFGPLLVDGHRDGPLAPSG